MCATHLANCQQVPEVHKPGLLFKTFGWIGASLVLLAVFAMYTRPEFLVTLADHVWSCF